MRLLSLKLLFVFMLPGFCQPLTAGLNGYSFTNRDSLLVTNADGKDVLDWRADAMLIPASLTKLLIASLTLTDWGAEHVFVTHYYVDSDCLWVKGSGDPFMISEELEQIAGQLNQALQKHPDIRALCLDNSLFNQLQLHSVTSADPYNAPNSAIGANFNTAKLKRMDSRLQSAEPQTPLTRSAVLAAEQHGLQFTDKGERFNLYNVPLALQNYAEILLHKMGRDDWPIRPHNRLPDSAVHLFGLKNSRTLTDAIEAAFIYSNNYIANQLYLLLARQLIAPEQSLSGDLVRQAIENRIQQYYGWNRFSVYDGAGLSRDNRLSARQIMQVLDNLTPYTDLFKSYHFSKLEQRFTTRIRARAKSGSLHDVHAFAGFFWLDQHEYRFVFNFNRPMPWRYRQTLLHDLIEQILSEKMP